MPLQSDHTLPQSFKGIALFTPGGDVVYCIDVHKQNRWHLQLCAVLQEVLELSEPPHFLVPCYAATIDRWLDPQTHQVQTVAEACPLVLQHQAILNALFDLGNWQWNMKSTHEAVCDPIVLATYRSQFPQLWKTHELIIPVDSRHSQLPAEHRSAGQPWSTTTPELSSPGYVLRLFVAGSNAATERTLQTVHQLLEQFLHQPYTLKIVDVLRHPEQAELDQVTATPTLMKVYPPPIKRVVGDFSSPEKILQVLNS